MNKTSEKQAVIGIVMGSDSDWPVMQAAAKMLDELGVPYEARVVSAHRLICFLNMLQVHASAA